MSKKYSKKKIKHQIERLVQEVPKHHEYGLFMVGYEEKNHITMWGDSRSLIRGIITSLRNVVSQLQKAGINDYELFKVLNISAMEATMARIENSKSIYVEEDEEEEETKKSQSGKKLLKCDLCVEPYHQNVYTCYECGAKACVETCSFKCKSCGMIFCQNCVDLVGDEDHPDTICKLCAAAGKI